MAEQGEKHAGTIAALHAKSEQSVSEHQRLVERLTAQIGRPRTIYVLVAGVVGWAVLNEVLPRFFGHPPLDAPPFFWLQGALAVYAALVTTMVLTTQNRTRRAEQQRSYLELQVNLTAEEKTAKLIALLEELRRDMPDVRDRLDEQANAMSQTVDPHAVLNALEGTLQSKPPPSSRG